MTETPKETAGAELAFSQFELLPDIQTALDEVGYETPTPIQARTIPLLLEGRDVVGQAQTGTGKTAAFALPLLSRIEVQSYQTQLLVLAPTRELAIQVAEACQKYARHIDGFHVLPVYGGQDYRGQIKALKRGAHVVVGTPGRVMDHMRRGTLKLGGLKALVLDEADEMLKMGFIDDVEWILSETPASRQIALFSATMPPAIRKIAESHMNNPEQITIKVKTTTAETITQRYWPVQGVHKLDALTRILEAESFDGMIVFVRTKTATVDLADKLLARGFSAAALNGDVPQNLRERTVDHLKKGQIDILVATDVAARGLDVDRISHVINYDIPHDTEAYVHRIGRTGRAGRMGDAILFVAPREKRMLAAIERATRKPIDMMALPSTDAINARRIEKFKTEITEILEGGDLDLFTTMIEEYTAEHDVTAVQVAAALAQMAQGEGPFLLSNKPLPPVSKDWGKDDGRDRGSRKDRFSRERGGTRRQVDREEGMTRYRLEVGHRNKVMPGNIVGAIANEANIDSKVMGRIQIFDDFSLIDLPDGLPNETINHLKGVWVAGKQLKMSEDRGRPEFTDRGGPAPRGSHEPTGSGLKKDWERKPSRGKPSFASKGKPERSETGSSRPKPDFKSKPKPKPKPRSKAASHEAPPAETARPTLKAKATRSEEIPEEKFFKGKDGKPVKDGGHKPPKRRINRQAARADKASKVRPGQPGKPAPRKKAGKPARARPSGPRKVLRVKKDT